MAVYALFKVTTYDQVAVLYLKIAMQSPMLLLSMLVSILVVAPILEEFLFRGLLQTYLKNYLGKKGAIFVAALLFGLFHFNSAQGVGNISIILSLFSFGCFLGFIYERQGSLLASISLHATFNAINVLYILSQQP